MSNSHATDNSPAIGSVQCNALLAIAIGNGNTSRFHLCVPSSDGIQALQIFGQSEGDLIVAYNGTDIGIGGQLAFGQSRAVVSSTGQSQIFIDQTGYVPGHTI